MKQENPQKLYRILPLHEGWTFEYEGKEYPACVPGDISDDLKKAGLIPDPFYGDNYKSLGWVSERDWTYSLKLNLSKEDLAYPEISLDCEMLDTYADIYCNGELVGKCESMFVGHSYSLKPYLHEGENVLQVTFLSIRKKCRELHNPKYHASFNNDRIFVRKPQCQFGWDWAPDYVGTGFAGDVKLYFGSGYRIASVFPKTYNDGNVSFLVEPNGNNRLEGQWQETKGFQLKVETEQIPGKGFEKGRAPLYEVTVPLFGQRNIINTLIEHPQLWYPNGYGKQPLYAYRVSLLDENGNILDEKEGKFGIRELKLDQSPFHTQINNFRFLCNDVPIYCTGSNWVPISPLVGTIKEEDYRKLLLAAKQASLTMLRVWGGGLYEKDAFYDLCDEYGILVFQDFMFSCQFIPDDVPGFRETIEEEATYQVKRLRSHPSLAVYSAGNEMADAMVVDRKQKISLYSQYILLRGVAGNEDPTRPYLWDSPSSLTDVGMDRKNGETHVSVLDAAIVKNDLAHYQDYFVSGEAASFVSEGATMGMCRLRSFEKFMPEEKRWPINSLWEDRLASNPYSPCASFVEREKRIVNSFFGEATSLEDFIKKSEVGQAELMSAEFAFQRSHVYNSGFMNWMWNDTWGTGTWSVVDSYFERKPAYYALKRIGAPRAAFFAWRGPEGQYGSRHVKVCLINNTAEPWDGACLIRQVSLLDGKVINEEKKRIHLEPFDGASRGYFYDDSLEHTYLYLSFGDKEAVLFPRLWKNESFVSDLSYQVSSSKNKEGYSAKLTLTAHAFARVVKLEVKGDPEAEFSDNYFDLPAGETKVITIHSTHPLKKSDLSVLTYADVWEE